ncbi:unnamed protein product [Adineta steineri]|uniref:Uncharacterized protein n=1 Tax=Adineta steineri TaxID=433720 RepID=A0A819R8B5_9BILA|nr:unnamed protein product [Adineta steineri]
MFVHLAKRIAMPGETSVTKCGWNAVDGYVSAGCADGLVKVLKLEIPETGDARSRGVAGQAQLTKNQTLEGHSNAISSIAWNERFGKLTTADSNGTVIVWVDSAQNEFVQDMLNNRTKNRISDMKWNSTGQMICIGHEDGNVIIGSVEGSRIAGKSLKNNKLAKVEWSPDSRLLLFGFVRGEIHIYDVKLNYLAPIQIFCIREGVPSAEIAGIEWYDGSNGLMSANCKSLVICYENGAMQLMSREDDPSPIILDVDMHVVSVKWNDNGSMLAVAGYQTTGDKTHNFINFYSPWGEHLRSLKVTGKTISDCAWEAHSLRIVIAIDNFIYFANCRLDYKWCYIQDTVIYSFYTCTRPEHIVVFWNTKTNEVHYRYVRNLLGIGGYGSYCCIGALVERIAPPMNNAIADTHVILLCNSIGITIESKYVPFQPVHICVTESYAIISAKSLIYIWGISGFIGSQMVKKQSFEKFIQIDDPATVRQGDELQLSLMANETEDPITSISATDKWFFVARSSGLVLRYSLPACNLMEKIECQFHISKIALNPIATLMSVIDINGNCMLIDLESKEPRDEITNFKKSDVWNVIWAKDLSDSFAIMEKTKISFVRGTETEEAVPCSGYVCDYNNLQVKVVMLDEIMKMHLRGVQAPSSDYITIYDNKLLRDMKTASEKLPLEQVSSLIEKDPHPQLWRALAEEALNHLDIKVAEHAFVKVHDYYGLQFLRRLQQFQGEQLKRAEIAAFLKRDEEVEKIYIHMDRKDLAYQLRRKLGDWFRVVQILQSGTVASDAMQNEAWNELGDFYYDRQQWATAVKYYEQSGNNSQAFHCYALVEDYAALEKLSRSLQENDPLLKPIGDTFATVGLSEQAVDAYKRCNRVQEAVQMCIEFSQWDMGIELARQYNLNDVKSLLTRQAKTLLSQNKPFDAIELYKKSANYLEAAKILYGIAENHSKENRPLLIKKKMYILCGLLIEKYRTAMKTTSRKEKKSTATISASDALQGLLTEETTGSGGVSDTQLIDNVWRPAEAYHFYILAQQQFKANNADGALRSALTLSEYEDIIPVQTIYNLIALCATSCGAFSTASKAFLKLEDDSSINEEDRKEYQKLAFQIFLSHICICHFTMTYTNQQPLHVHNLNKNSLVPWTKSHQNHTYDWNNEQEEYRIPIIQLTPRSDRSDNVEKEKSASIKNHIKIQEPPINDYFKQSLFACLTCFWMIAGIVCLIQSIKIRKILKKNNQQYNDEAKRRSNCLYTNLILTSQPKDKRPVLSGQCPQCSHRINDWCLNCPQCDWRFPPCIVTGRPIIEYAFWICPACKHRALQNEMARLDICPFCHSSVNG